MWQLALRGVIAGVIVAAVIGVSNRSPRLGAFLLTLPVVSILAFLMAWNARGDLDGISKLARETLVLVPLGLPFFVPLAFAQRLGWGSGRRRPVALAGAEKPRKRPIGCVGGTSGGRVSVSRRGSGD